MTKVAIRTLDSVTNNDTTATQLINENFQALQTAIENTLSRDGTTPNFMDANLDLNSYKIINAGTPTDNTDVITKEYFDQNVGDAAGYAAAAASSAQQASTFASSASSYAAAATGAANIAQAARDYIESDPGFIAVSTDLQMGVNGSIYKVNANKTNIDTVAGDINQVNLVADDIASVHTVAVDISNVIDVAGNKTNIDTVAGSIVNVNAVGTDIANVNTVAGDLTNIDTVAGDLTNINTVAGIAGDVSTVAGISSDVTAVKNNATNINAVAGNNSNITAVAGNATNINAVNANKTNIDTVATNINNVNSVAGDLTNINSVAGDLTNIDAVGSNITNVNTVAGDHANIQTVVNNMTAINAAPTYANNAKKWAEGTDSEVTPLGGTHSSKGWAEIAEAAASGVQNPANRDLSNLTAAGQLVIDSQNGTISNCILEIPQNIKLTLENNVLTLKSGSVLTLTGSTYATVTTTADQTHTVPNTLDDGRYYIMSSNGGFWQPSAEVEYSISNDYTTSRGVASGSSLPVSGARHSLFYNTTDNKIYMYSINTSSWEDRTTSNSACYPLCIIEMNSGVASFAKDSNGNDMIFNGFGYIGSTVFALPGVKGLIPDGRNEDGSLKNTEYTNTIIQTHTDTGMATQYICIGIERDFYRPYYEQESQPNTSGLWYNPITNLLKRSTDNGVTWVNRREFYCVIYSTDSSGKVTSFTIRQPVRLATTEMLENIQKDFKQGFYNTFNKKVLFNVSVDFPGKSDTCTAITTLAGETCNDVAPQAAYKYDDELYVLFWGVGDNGSISGVGVIGIWNYSSGVFKQWHVLSDARPSESLVIKKESNTLYLYTSSSTNKVIKYQLDTTNGSSLNIVAGSHSTVDAAQFLSYYNGTWLVKDRENEVQGQPPAGLKLYDDNWNYKTQIAWQRYNYDALSDYSAKDKYQMSIPHLQGMCLFRDGVYLFKGGSSKYDGQTSLDGISLDNVSANGVIQMSFFGDIVKSSIVKSSGLRSKLSSALGQSVTTSENEGGLIIDGKICSFQKFTIGGEVRLVVLEEFSHDNGIDCSEYAFLSSNVPFKCDHQQYPRSKDGNFYNPWTGEQMTSLDDVVIMMAIYGMDYLYISPDSTWNTLGSVTITNLNYGCSIQRIKSDSFIVSVQPLTEEIGHFGGVYDVTVNTTTRTVTSVVLRTARFGDVEQVRTAAGYSSYSFQNTAITKGTAPASNTGFYISLQDSSGLGSSARLGAFQMQYNANGVMQTSMIANKPVSGGAGARISLYYPPNGNPYASCPTPTEDTTNSTQIDTVGARNTKLADYQTTANLVTSVSSSSTDSQYPSAKLFYDTCGDIETLINAL